MYLRLMRLLMACCMLCLVCITCVDAAENESIQVHIPVIASGADCDAALYDSRGHRIQLLSLEKDIGNAFIVECDGLLQTRYTAVVYNEDDDDVRYDRSMYTIYINVFYGEDGALTSSVIIEHQAADGTQSGKMGMIRFENHLIRPPVVPTPLPTATPVPYKERFTFRKVWSGDVEDSIDWVMYNSDGSVHSKKFNKTVISKSEWQYEAYFQYNVDDCYIVEYVPDGYMVSYVNVGPYADVTDRCHNGGTIINRKVPQTGDPLPLGLHVFCLLAAGAGLALLVLSSRRRCAG